MPRSSRKNRSTINLANYSGNDRNKIDFTPIPFRDSPNFVQVNGQNCYALMCESFYVKQHVGYAMRMSDFKFCIEVLDYIEKMEDPNEQTIVPFSLKKALIITYGRAFAESSLNGTLLKRTHVPERYRGIHDYLVNERNNVVAHATGAQEGTRSGVALYPNNQFPKVLLPLPVINGKISTINSDRRILARKLCTEMYEFCRTKSDEFLKKNFELIKRQDLENLYKHFEYEPNTTPYIPNVSYTISFRIGNDGKMFYIGTPSNNAE